MIHLLPVFHELFDSKKIKITADERTNSLIVQGDEPSLKKIEMLMSQIDVKVDPKLDSARQSSMNPYGTGYAPSAGNGVPMGSYRVAESPTQLESKTNTSRGRRLKVQENYDRQNAMYRRSLLSIRGKKTEYIEAEREAAELAAQVRNADNDSPERQALESKLKKAVEEVFDLRQKSQEKEVETLRKRLEKVNASLQKRIQLRDKIIARRIDDLLEQDALRWEADPPATSSRQ